MTAGRPTKYEPEFCQRCIDFMGLGYSLTAFAGELGVARHTINDWMAAHPEFLQATRIGQATRTKSLEATLIAGETGPKVTGHIFALKNADPEGWKDKREYEVPGGINITITSDDAKL